MEDREGCEARNLESISPATVGSHSPRRSRPTNHPNPPTGLMTMLGGMDRAESVSNDYFLRLTGKWASIQAANPPFKL